MNNNNQPTMPNPALQPDRPPKPPLPAPRPSSRQQAPARARPENRSGQNMPQPGTGVQPVPGYGVKPIALPQPPVMPRAGQLLPARPAKKSSRKMWLIAIPVFLLVCLLGVGALLAVGVGALYADGILPGVRTGDVSLAGLSETQAANKLADAWDNLTLRDQGRVWNVNPVDIGITLDAAATAAGAYEQGRGAGNPLEAILGKAQVTPVVSVDAALALSGLNNLAVEFNQPAVNAGVALVNGSVQATAPQNGRQINLEATVQNLMKNPADALKDGVLELVMNETAPDVSDASAMVAQASALLSNPLAIRVFDPVTGDSVYWSVAPETWGNWLSAVPADTAIGLSLSLNDAALRDYLNAQAAASFDESRTIEVDAGIASLQTALANGTPDKGYVVVKHQPRSYVVQAGETITSIAWDFGIPYLYIMEVNGGIESVSVGQTITLPPADKFLLYAPVADKRIVVSISQQHTWVYENGQLKWDWVSSTGISSSPTWPGIYQVISHEENAYAGNWNLYMPWFIGVYQPIPGAEFTNGFHGFPTRGGGQLLWEGSLGHKVTYGCILLSSTNSKALYEWAEEGVVVEIQA